MDRVKIKVDLRLTRPIFVLDLFLIMLIHVCEEAITQAVFKDLDDNSPFSPNSPFSSMEFAANYETDNTENNDFESWSGEKANEDLPMILWWSGQLHPHGHYEGDMVTRIKCKDVYCYTTNNRNFLKDYRTRGIIFYGTDVDPNDLPLPRKPDHEWALFHEESPMNNYMLSHQTFIKLFNHTATFRRESDYPLTSQNIYALKYLTERNAVPLKVKNEEKLKRKLAPIMYAQSHDGVPSDRDRYVEELMKYIDIDSYGTCLHNKDLPAHLRDPAENFEIDEFLDFISVYKFHLAFENGICKDYMTEKLMRPLHVGSVPIYRGSSDARDWMPDNTSVIMAEDFQTPKQLADFIDFLDKNDDEYEKYMSYRKPGGIVNPYLLDHMSRREWGIHSINYYYDPDKQDYFRGYECHVCRKINERKNVERAHELDPYIPLLPPRMANNSHLGCPQPYPSIGDPDDIPKSDRWHEMDWISIYWSDFDRARAARKMIEAGESDSGQFQKYLNQVYRERRNS